MLKSSKRIFINVWIFFSHHNVHFFLISETLRFRPRIKRQANTSFTAGDSFPSSLPSQTEYKYCYDLVLHYVLHYLNKDMNEKK